MPLPSYELTLVIFPFESSFIQIVYIVFFAINIVVCSEPPLFTISIIAPISTLIRLAVLRSMPPGESMNKGKGYDDVIGCTACSLSHLIQQVLVPYLIPMTSSCFAPHVYLIALLWTYIYSVDTLLYPYALPLDNSPYLLSSLCLRLQPELQLKVVTFGKASMSSPCKRGIYERYQTELPVGK